MGTEDGAGMTATLAAFVERTTFADLPPVTIDNAKLAILDTMACALGAARFRVGSIMIDYVRDLGAPGPATVWSGGFRTSAPMAAWVNGHLANALDYDLSLHLDTHVLPAAVAMGEQLRVSGVSFLEAYVVAGEVGARLMKALDGKRSEGSGVSHRGWWHVGLVGPLDASLAAAKLLQLDERAIATTLGIASASVGGFRRSLGTMAKSLHSGRSARDGIHAAQLAKSGLTADPEILEAPMGLIAALCPGGEFDYDAIYDGLGSKYSLESPPKCKPFPACGPANSQIDGVLELLRTTPVDVAEIDRILVNVHPHSLFRPEARDEIEAGFSTPYIMAVTLIDGAFGLRQLADARIHDPRVRALMERVEDDPNAPDHRVTVHLRDGRELVGETNERRTLRTSDEITEKFDASADTRITLAAAAEFKDAVAHLETIGDISRLTDILHRGATHARHDGPRGTPSPHSAR